LHMMLVNAAHGSIRKPNGVILYRGPSLLDGSPIVAIAVGLRTRSTNTKTGAMLQTYILRSDMDPLEAIRRRVDDSICGNCPHRGTPTAGRTCYVQVGQGPQAVYKAYKRGLYPVLTAETIELCDVRGRTVRLGTYGDPAAVPAWVWEELITDADG